jgi:hypothetical protein
MPHEGSKNRNIAIAVGAVILLLLLLVWLGGSDDGAADFTVRQAVHEVTSLPNQTLHLYNRVAPRSWQLRGTKVPSAVAADARAAPRRGQSKFVGAFGRTPGMQHCLDYDTSTDKTYDFNRCTWV